MRQLKKIIVARFDDSITTYDPSIGGILLGNNNERDHSYFSFMNPFLYFKNKVFFSGGKTRELLLCSDLRSFCPLSSESSAYIFLYFFLSNFKVGGILH